MQLRSQVEALEAREAAALASATTASGKEEQVRQLSQELQDERTRCREALRGKTDLERQLLVLKAEVEGQWRNTEVASDTIKSLRTQKKALESEVEAAASKASAEIAKAKKERDAAYEKVANQKVNFRNLLEERDRYAERLNNALARAESTTRELEAQRCALEEAQTAAEHDRKSSAKTSEHTGCLLQKLQQLEADLAATKAELALANSILVEKDEHISRIAADRRALLSQSGRSCEDCMKLPDELRLQNAEINRLKDLLTGVRKESSDKDGGSSRILECLPPRCSWLQISSQINQIDKATGRAKRGRGGAKHCFGGKQSIEPLRFQTSPPITSSAGQAAGGRIPQARAPERIHWDRDSRVISSAECRKIQRENLLRIPRYPQCRQAQLYGRQIYLTRPRPSTTPEQARE